MVAWAWCEPDGSGGFKESPQFAKVKERGGDGNWESKSTAERCKYWWTDVSDDFESINETSLFWFDDGDDIVTATNEFLTSPAPALFGVDHLIACQVEINEGRYTGRSFGVPSMGKGKITRVDVSVDGGRNWRTARLQTPVLDKCLTRFNIDWVWDGKPAIVQSRAMDDTGFVQPSYKQLRAVRGTRSIYHNNAIQSWLVQESGEVKNVQLS